MKSITIVALFLMTFCIPSFAQQGGSETTAKQERVSNRKSRADKPRTQNQHFDRAVEDKSVVKHNGNRFWKKHEEREQRKRDRQIRRLKRSEDKNRKNRDPDKVSMRKDKKNKVKQKDVDGNSPFSGRAEIISPANETHLKQIHKFAPLFARPT